MPGSLLDDLPSGSQGDRSLDNLVGLLDGSDDGGPATSATDPTGRPVQRKSGHFRPLSLSNVGFDPATGRFGYQGGSSPQNLSNGLSPTSWLSFPDFTIDWVLDDYTDATEFALYITTPSAVLYVQRCSTRRNRTSSIGWVKSLRCGSVCDLFWELVPADPVPHVCPQPPLDGLGGRLGELEQCEQ